MLTAFYKNIFIFIRIKCREESVCRKAGVRKEDFMATVILDAGHGGYDNGASYNGRTEKEDNLNLALAVGNILENNGVDVLYTRTEDVYQSPNEKARIGNNSGADYFISFHRNASPNPGTYSGVQTLVYENEGIPALFAENINNNLEKVGYKNLGVSERKNLAVLRGTKMPAVLIETGFLNTEQDNTLFDLKFPEIAQAIADAIMQTVKGEVSSSEMQIYSVETGIFRHYDNARSLAEGMQEDGFDCFILPWNKYYSVCHGAVADVESASAASEEIFSKGYEARVIARIDGN